MHLLAQKFCRLGSEGVKYQLLTTKQESVSKYNDLAYVTEIFSCKL